MKKSISFKILFFLTVLFVYCNQAPQKKIIGEWIYLEENITVTFKSDSTVVFDNEINKWQMNDKEPLGIKFFDLERKFLAEFRINTFTNDQIELVGDRGKITLKRKADKKATAEKKIAKGKIQYKAIWTGNKGIDDYEKFLNEMAAQGWIFDHWHSAYIVFRK